MEQCGKFRALACCELKAILWSRALNAALKTSMHLCARTFSGQALDGLDLGQHVIQHDRPKCHPKENGIGSQIKISLGVMDFNATTPCACSPGSSTSACLLGACTPADSPVFRHPQVVRDAREVPLERFAVGVLKPAAHHVDHLCMCVCVCAVDWWRKGAAALRAPSCQ